MNYRGRAHPPSRRRPLAEWPGVRTFRSRLFRMIVAATLAVVAVGLLAGLLVQQARDPHGQYGVDFVYWHLAAQDVAAGRSPYPARYLEAPVVATDFGYKYPPFFAQTLRPVAGLPFFAAATIWAAVQTVMAFLAVWLALIFGGGKRDLEGLLWSAVAAVFYLPLWDSIWKGNVSAVQAFQIALILGGGAVAGASLASAILLKTTPAALAPAALVHGGRLLYTAMLGGMLIVTASVLQAPSAWVDFARMQVNLFTGPSASATNLQPASMVALAIPDLPELAAGIRLLTIGAGIGAIGGSVLLARRPDGWPAAVLLGTVAMLMIPGSVWYHYLAMLLPLAAFAWPRATGRQRLSLVGGTAPVALGLAWLPLATLGATLLSFAILRVLTPRVDR